MSELNLYDLPRCRSVRIRPAVRTTGARGWCGPTAIAALTGCTVEEAKTAIRKVRGALPGGRGWRVSGTHNWEILQALYELGVQTCDKWGAPAEMRDRPTVARWLKSRQGAWRTDPLLIVAGHHYLVVQGRRYVCSLTKGEMVSIRQAPKRRARMKTAWRLTKREML